MCVRREATIPATFALVSLLGIPACATDRDKTASDAPEISSTRSRTVETIVTCEEGDGDQWRSVGIALADGNGLTAYVVDNDADDDGRTLVLSRTVSAVPESDNATVYRDEHDAFRLTVAKDPTSARLVGSLATLVDGFGGMNLSGLDCFEKSTIKFDIACAPPSTGCQPGTRFDTAECACVNDSAADCRTTGCPSGESCSTCWGGLACIPTGARC